MSQREDKSPASEAPPQGRYLTVQEIASELGQPLYLVRHAVAALAAKIPWKEQEREGRRVGKRLYHESGLAAIVKEIGKRRKRPKNEDTAGAYWRARASLRLLKRDANAFADVAAGIYELLKRNPPSDEMVVVHALPHSELALLGPTTLSLRLIRGRLWQATLPDLPLMGSGKTQAAATRTVFKKLAAVYLSLEQDPSADPEGWQILRQLVRRLDLSETSEPAGPQPQTAVVESETTLTFTEWLQENAPQQRYALSIAWRRGAGARLHGRRQCSYRQSDLIEAWNDGFATMSRYLEAGGVLACPSCMQPLAT